MPSIPDDPRPGEPGLNPPYDDGPPNLYDGGISDGGGSTGGGTVGGDIGSGAGSPVDNYGGSDNQGPTQPGDTATPPQDFIPQNPNDPTGSYKDIDRYAGGSTGGAVNLSKPDVNDLYNPGQVNIPEMPDMGPEGEFVPWEVTREQTMQGQLTDLYNRDSPFFQMARERGVRRHLAGGGQNSAMAAQAGEIAAMDKAFEVARQDAALYARSAEFNAGMQNQFSLAHQRFMHNALLSDQNYKQAIEMEKLRADAQFEQIRMDYKGRGLLMDKEIAGKIKLLWEGERAFEGREQRGFDRQMTLQGMTQMTNFWTQYVSSTMQYASNPNWTPAQAQGALNEGLQSGNQLFDYLQSFWGGYAAGGPPNNVGPPGFSDWWNFSNAPGNQAPLPGGG